MRWTFAIAIALACSACSQQDAPADEVVKAAEQLVDPASKPTPLARGPYAPQDTCDKVAGAEEFRTALASAVADRNADALVAMAADDIMLDFGGSGGVAEFRKRLEDPSWDLWAELDKLMHLGCSANSQGGITIPWFFDQDIRDLDPTAAMLVTGENVPVLIAPDKESDAAQVISWDLVQIATLNPDDPFQQVELKDGKTGFVATDRLRSVLDYRLTASSRNSRWKITSFIAGD